MPDVNVLFALAALACLFALPDPAQRSARRRPR